MKKVFVLLLALAMSFPCFSQIARETPHHDYVNELADSIDGIQVDVLTMRKLANHLIENCPVPELLGTKCLQCVRARGIIVMADEADREIRLLIGLLTDLMYTLDEMEEEE